jgi:hypothetical protein
MPTPRASVSLTTAAKLLRVSYFVARDMLLKGQLDGYQTRTGRWRIQWTSVQRLRTLRLPVSCARPAPTDADST